MMQEVIENIQELQHELGCTDVQSYEYHYIATELCMLHEQLATLV